MDFLTKIRENKRYLFFGFSLLLLSIIYISVYISVEPLYVVGERCDLVVYLLVDYSNYTLQNQTFCVPYGMSVFNILNTTQNISYIDYSSLGYFVVSINGVSQNKTHFWFYYVDGVFANKGSSSFYITKNHTVILWKLESTKY